MTEHFAGAFPVWLCPVQAIVLPINEEVNDYAKGVYDKLLEAGIRVNLDDRYEKLGFKIREAQVKRIPYMIVIGNKEMEEKSVSIRYKKDGDIGKFSVEELIDKILDEIETKKC